MHKERAAQLHRLKRFLQVGAVGGTFVVLSASVASVTNGATT
jgi:hypothetical protein